MNGIFHFLIISNKFGRTSLNDFNDKRIMITVRKMIIKVNMLMIYFLCLALNLSLYHKVTNFTLIILSTKGNRRLRSSCLSI